MTCTWFECFLYIAGRVEVYMAGRRPIQFESYMEWLAHPQLQKQHDSCAQKLHLPLLPAPLALTPPAAFDREKAIHTPQAVN